MRCVTVRDLETSKNEAGLARVGLLRHRKTELLLTVQQKTPRIGIKNLSVNAAPVSILRPIQNT